MLEVIDLDSDPQESLAAEATPISRQLRGDVKIQLEEHLEAVSATAAGSFATADVFQLNEVPSPLLSVEGYGSLRLPLSGQDAERLAEVAHQAPFGKGSDTIIDTSVRNTLELDASQFQFQNGQWKIFIDNLLDRVSVELGIAGGREVMRADPYKLLLYKEGAFFDKHKDSEKDHGMFGTLIIALPSKHTGGEVETRFGDKTKVLETAPSSTLGYSYLAWYADVEHQIKKVTSGYRLVLTYNLIHTSPAASVQSADSLGNTKASILDMREFFGWWTDQTQSLDHKLPKHLAYALEHEYTDANLRLNHLKGKDRLMATALMEASRHGKGAFFLANLQRMVVGGCDDFGTRYDPWDRYRDESDYDSATEEEESAHHPISELIEETLELRLVVNPDGSQYAKGVSIDEKDIVQEDIFNDVPDEEDYEAYTGNAGPDVTHYYRKSAFLVMPKHLEVDFFFNIAKEHKADVQRWLDSALSQYFHEPSEDLRTDIVRMCNLVVELVKNEDRENDYRCYGFNRFPSRFPSRFPHNTIGAVIGSACRLEIVDLFKSAAQQTCDRHSDVVFRQIGSALRSVSANEWLSGVDLCLSPLDKFRQRYDVVKLITTEMDSCQNEENSITVMDWAARTVRQSLLNVAHFDKEDADFLVEVAKENEQQYMFKNILPAVKNHLTNRAFIVAFCNSIGQAEKNGSIEHEIASNVFKDIFFNLASDFELECRSPEQIRTGGWGYTPRERVNNVPNGIDGPDLALSIRYALHFQAYKPVVQILAKVNSSLNSVTPSALKMSVIPLLPKLSIYLDEHNVPTSEEQSQAKGDTRIPLGLLKNLYWRALAFYFKGYVRARPIRPTNWIRNEVRCSCRDCNSLNSFLRDPTRQVGRFPMGSNRRAHLHQALSSHTKCEHITEHVGNPHTLVVTKTLNEHQFESIAWGKRYDEAIGLLEVSAFDVLQGLLGPGLQQPLKDCEWVKDALNNSRPLAPLKGTTAKVNSSGPPPVKGRVERIKTTSGKTVEVIDLT